MRRIAILLLLGFLQGCALFENKTTLIKPPQSVPKVWQAQGKIGVIFNGKSENASFEVDFKKNDYQLILTTLLGLGQVIIKSNNQGLLVDEKLLRTNFKQWMKKKAGWHFPIQDLGKIAFNQHFDNSDWNLKVLSRYSNHLPKTIRLIHTIKDIKIKLFFKDIAIATLK